ncbi:hypothetical protein DL546_004313 [Coniochaeta pulveracea]|uniref:Uncharacterized protein n=1 Tax=Coniochaeta pulveracea TaxID=177199 RepID=A0A420Y1Z6_9PEZI|nr:hypothetical protein DL546_004313 [Coniochaeta pulveracea]
MKYLEITLGSRFTSIGTETSIEVLPATQDSTWRPTVPKRRPTAFRLGEDLVSLFHISINKAKKSLAKVPTNVDETDTDNEGALEGSTTIATPVATTSRRHIQTPAKDCGNLGEDSNEDEDGPPRSAKRRRVGNRRVVIDQTHPRLVRRREELLRLAPEEQEASPSATVAYNQPPAVDHREGLGTATEDRNAVMPPMTYGDFDERVNRHVEARLAEFLASQREQILRDFDGRLAEHLANFSNRLASGVRATEAGPPRSPSRLTNAAPPSLPAARHSLPTLRPAAGARQVFQTTASGIPFIYPPSHNPALRHPSGISTSIQPSPSVTSSTPARRSANNTAGRAPAIPAPDGSPEAPVIVPTSSDDDTPEKKKEQEGEEM